MTLEELINEAVELNVLPENTTTDDVKQALRETLPKECSKLYWNEYLTDARPDGTIGVTFGEILDIPLIIKSIDDIAINLSLNGEKYSLSGYVDNNTLVVSGIGNYNWTKSLELDNQKSYVKLAIDPYWCTSINGNYNEPAAWML